MNILDENLPESQRQLLRSWRIPIRQIGIELRHLTFNTQAKRAGAVIRVSPTGLRVWHVYADKEEKVEWCIP